MRMTSGFPVATSNAAACVDRCHELDWVASNSDVTRIDYLAISPICLNDTKELSMNKIMTAVMSACLMCAVSSVYAQDAMKPASGSMAKDSMSKDGMAKDGMAKDSMKKDSMKKDSMSKDAMSKDSMSKDSMSKDSMSKDSKAQ
jgi:pentapeptide MXKDX repeat protein